MSKTPAGAARRRRSAFDMPAGEFRAIGHELVDRIAEFYDSMGERDLTRLSQPDDVRQLLGAGDLPEEGTDPARLFAEAAPVLFDHSLHNGHPKFMGFITSSAAPVGALADLLAAAVNANVARWELSPVASEIESTAIHWVSDFIGYDPNASGLMVSGGNMANFVAFVAARTAQAPWDIRKDGNYPDARRLTAYVSAQTHTWIQKAADVCGLGADGIRWIETDHSGRMRLDRLREQILADREAGRLPFLVVGTAGSVSLGIVDPLREIAALCEQEKLWFHVDGAYGAPAAALPEAPQDLHALSLADSVAVDPHKWLYCPIEAACVMTRHPQALQSAFSFRPEYYRLDGRKASGTDFYELGMQNTRAFRALKVWLMFRTAGRAGYVASIRDDIRLARRLFDLVDQHAEFSTHTVNLSVATFRYVPGDLRHDRSAVAETYLDTLNQAVLAEVQANGEAFLSNAVVDGHYLLRACVVNFRTAESDIDSLPEMVAEIGRRLDRELRPD
jgi:glutamate/tyrosine decarboxylase-like PLP-dependent enzyme